MKTVCNEDTIRKAVTLLAIEMQALTPDKPILLIPILMGAMTFCCDLARLLPNTTIIKPIFVRRPDALASRPEIRLFDVPSGSFWKSHATWIIDDCIFSGETLWAVSEKLEKHTLPILGKPVDFRTAVLFEKPYRGTRLETDLVGIKLSRSFAVGYGSDEGDRWRGLKELCVP